MGESPREWVIMHSSDDVATALNSLPSGTEIAVPDTDIRIALRQDIPFGHKFAIRPIGRGQPVRKYGQIIGSATQTIAPGDHVHVHNVESRRGRGDLVGKEGGS